MTLSRVSEFEASLMKIVKGIFCDGANVRFATGRIIIVNVIFFLLS